jgi:hypothetical protein
LCRGLSQLDRATQGGDAFCASIRSKEDAELSEADDSLMEGHVDCNDGFDKWLAAAKVNGCA